MKPNLVVTTTLQTPSTLTVDARGEWDSGTILGTAEDKYFRVQHFAFYDLTTSEPVVHDLFPGTCERDRDDFVELYSSKPRAMQTMLDDISPHSDPVNILKPGHQYRIRLKPQKIKGFAGSIGELLARRKEVSDEEKEEDVPEEEWIPEEKRFPNPMMITLACDEELLLNVEV